MGTNTLETAYSNGEIIDASHINELTESLLNAFVGRNSSGVPEAGKSLGTAALPWGNIYGTGLILNGLAVDPSTITTLPNRVVSGRTRTLSSLGDFLRADGTTNAFTLLAASTELVLSINNTAVTYDSDQVKTSITLAPSTNNTCDINDANMVNSKYAGELDAFRKVITIDNAGSEITNRIGQIAAFKTPTNEILIGKIESATEIRNVLRGYYIDDAGDPIKRGVLSNNDTLTFLQIGWVFAEDDANTIDISYSSPSISYNAPTSPVTGQYWFDISNQLWKRYSGTEFETVNRILIGQVVSDDTATVASRSYDFTKQFKETNNLEIELESTEIVRVKSDKAVVNVYGVEITVDLSAIRWNITTDLESGLTEASDTTYYLYLGDDARPIISDQRPHKRPDLKGFYHPYESYRCVGSCYNDGSSNLIIVKDGKYNVEVGPKSMKVGHEESSGVQGGTMPTGSFGTKKLNVPTTFGNNFLNLNSNQINLLDGKYYVRGFANGMECGSVRTRLQNITTGLTQLTGSNGYSSTAGSSPEMSNSFIEGEITVEDTEVIEIQLRGSSAGPAYAQGFPSSFGIQEVYAEYIFTEIRE